LLRTASPIQPLFSCLPAGLACREDTAFWLAYDPLGRTHASSFGTRPSVNDRLSRYRRLATRTMHFPFRLRSLGCSRLSPGVIATMNRSDSSWTPKRLALPLTLQFQERVSAFLGIREVSLGHTRLCSAHPDAKHVTGSCAGLRLLRQAGPPVPPYRVHCEFRARFWLGPFTSLLAGTGCRCLLGVLPLHRSPGGI